jgi:ketosteroid isomerase-like protein
MKWNVLLRFLTILLFLPVVAFGHSLKSNLPQTPEQELIELTRRWDKALVTRDADTLNRILSDDYTFAHSPKAQYLAFLQLPEIEYKSYERSGITARIYGETAILFGKASLSGKHPGVDWFSSSFNFMDVWIKQDGRWKCVATMHDQIQGATSRGTVRVGPEVKAGLVIVFKPGATDKQVNHFWLRMLQAPPQDERVYQFREGILSALKVPPVAGHQALAIQFQEDASLLQKQQIKERIRTSPLVLKVFENIAPTDVKLK